MHANYRELEEMSQIPQLKDFISSVLNSEEFWKSKMIMDGMSKSLLKTANRLTYETYRTDRNNMTLFFKGNPILNDTRFIVKSASCMVASTRNKIYRISHGGASYIYTHPFRILALATNVTNTYFIDENYIIYSITFEIHNARRITCINSKSFRQRIVVINGITIRFRSDIMKINNRYIDLDNGYMLG